MPRGAAAAKKEDPAESTITDEDTSVGSEPAAPAAPAAAAAKSEPPEELGAPPGTCPECGHVNPPNNRFCASCGYRLDAKPSAAAKPAPAPAQGEKAAMLIALDPEGNEVGRHDLVVGDNLIGRDTGGIFGSDTFLSPHHATFTAKSGKVKVADQDSLNGIFRKLMSEQTVKLRPGQRFRIGQELLQYDELDVREPDGSGVTHLGGHVDGVVGTVALVVGRDTAQPSYPIPERGLNLGRERGDVLFPEDGYVSGLHCHVSYEDGDVFVTDLGSSNGTFVQLTEPADLRNGDVLLMGQQLFRIAI